MLSRIYRMMAQVREAFWRRGPEPEFDAELESHIQLMAEEYARKGMQPEQAMRRARVEFGGVTQLKEAYKEEKGLPVVETLRQDLRYSVRMMRHNPGFTLFTILIVGLGIGASSTVFSVVNTVLLRPLPFYDARELVWIANQGSDGVAEWSVQVGHMVDLRDRNQSFRDLAAYNSFLLTGDSKLSGDGETQRLSSVPVTENFFSLLGVQPMLGRTFTSEECKWNAPGVTILGYGLWKGRFRRRSDIVGRKITLNDQPVTVVGVAPESFDFATVFVPGNPVDLFTPMPLTAETNNWGNTLGVIGRLKPGATLGGARTEFTVLGAQLEKEHTDRNGIRPVLEPLGEHATKRARGALVVLSWAVGIVMLMVCANVANLQLARTAARQKEMAIRAAIGAGRRRLIRQMLTENLLLSCYGAVLGVVLAMIGTRLLAALDAFNIPLLATMKLDAATLGFSLAMAIGTGLLFGLAPALQLSGKSVQHKLQENGRSSTGSRRHNWIRDALVVTEIVFACVLVVGAGLVTRSFIKVMDVDLGFVPERVAAMRLDLGADPGPQEKINAFFAELKSEAGGLPGVQGVALTDFVPLGGTRSYAVAGVGQTYLRGEYPEGYIHVIGDGYLQTMGIALRAGREFTERDMAGSEPVALINESLAKTLWPGQEAVGQLVLGDGIKSGSPPRRVVGLVRDVHHRGLELNAGGELYLPMRQTNDFGSIYLVIRTAVAPGPLAAGVREVLKRISPAASIGEVRPVQDWVDKAVAPRRFLVGVLAAFSTFAVVLAALGIYAVIAYGVSQRKAEMGIRMALGASAGRLQGRMVVETLMLAGVGMVIGSAAAWVFGRALGALLFEVKFTDPATYVGMLVIIAGVAALAGYLPAKGIAKIDPMGVLRGE